MATAIERIQETREQKYGTVEKLAGSMDPTDWVTDLGMELGEACFAARDYHELRDPCDLRMFRECMVELAATGLAAVETMDYSPGGYADLLSIDSIRQERQYQIGKWGGLDQDAARDLTDWTTYVAAYLGNASFAAMDFLTPAVRNTNPAEALTRLRTAFVKVTTLGLAAAEVLDWIEENEAQTCDDGESDDQLCLTLGAEAA